MKLKTSIKTSAIDEHVSKIFDYKLTGTIETEIPDFIEPTDYGVGLIVGPSSSGKTTILKSLKRENIQPEWNEKNSVASHFSDYEEAKNRLNAAGLNSIPAWIQPYHTLSTGQRFRADVARVIDDNATIDEFTSVVDRNTAKSCAVSLSKYCKRAGLKNVILASCHYDIIEWLEPDWCFDCTTGKFLNRRLLRRPDIEIELLPSSTEVWTFFSKHHYLTSAINKSADCWIGVWEGKTVGFASAIAFPNGAFKKAYREHRTVVLPDFQGLGIGVRISDMVAEIYWQQGYRYFSKTANPAMGKYRNKVNWWKPTSKNYKKRPDYGSSRKTKESKYKMLHIDRLCFSHEYIRSHSFSDADVIKEAEGGR